MAMAFQLPRHEGQTTVDHKDGDPRNNALSNLRWASPSEQIKHSYATNAGRKSSAPKRSKPVRGRRVGDSAWTAYASSSEAARVLGLDQGAVSACCARKRKQTGGFEFELASPTEPARLDGEEWRRVEGTAAAVSSLGRFRSTTGVVSTPSPHPDGYVRVMVNHKPQMLHRLIAMAFQLPRRHEGQTTVDHEDGDPGNNALSNLCLLYTSPSPRDS